MSTAKKILLSVSIVVLILAGFYLKFRFYNPQYKHDIAAMAAKELKQNDDVRDGDLIFQTSLSPQNKVIQAATHSPYSHCGLIYKSNNEYFVYEAVQPIKLTPLEAWIEKGKNEHFVIKRLKDAQLILTPATLAKLHEVAGKYQGKNYDIYLGWSDDNFYSSELIWKIYKEATGIEIGKLQQLRDFDLTDAFVKSKMKERYGNNIPLDEPVISPASIFNSELLTTVKSE
ncbi:YiiX family permuted papain-like enzyme [Chitinophagaceae bacterium LWZ2-11]